MQMRSTFCVDDRLSRFRPRLCRFGEEARDEGSKEENYQKFHRRSAMLIETSSLPTKQLFELKRVSRAHDANIL